MSRPRWTAAAYRSSPTAASATRAIWRRRSRPVKDNAIYHLAAALTKISAYEFPVQFNDVNRAYFAGMAKIQAAKGEAAVADAMNAYLRDPSDARAIARCV